MAVMPKIYPLSASIDNAQDVKEQFIRFNRDYYPNEVYQFIFDELITQADCTGGHVELDVISWACDLASTALTETTFDDLDELVNYLNGSTTVLYVDEDDNNVWYIAY